MVSELLTQQESLFPSKYEITEFFDAAKREVSDRANREAYGVNKKYGLGEWSGIHVRHSTNVRKLNGISTNTFRMLEDRFSDLTFTELEFKSSRDQNKYRVKANINPEIGHYGVLESLIETSPLDANEMPSYSVSTNVDGKTIRFDVLKRSWSVRFDRSMSRETVSDYMKKISAATSAPEIYDPVMEQFDEDSEYGKKRDSEADELAKKLSTDFGLELTRDVLSYERLQKHSTSSELVDKYEAWASSVTITHNTNDILLRDFKRVVQGKGSIIREIFGDDPNIAISFSGIELKYNSLDLFFSDSYSIKKDRTPLTERFLEVQVEDLDYRDIEGSENRTFKDLVKQQIAAATEISSLSEKLSEVFNGSDIGVRSQLNGNLERFLKDRYGESIRLRRDAMSVSRKESFAEWFKMASNFGGDYEVCRLAGYKKAGDPLDFTFDGDTLHKTGTINISNLQRMIETLNLNMVESHEMLAKLLVLGDKNGPFTIYRGNILRRLDVDSVEFASKGISLRTKRDGSNFDYELDVSESRLEDYFKFAHVGKGMLRKKDLTEDEEQPFTISHERKTSNFEFSLGDQSTKDIDKAFEMADNFGLFQN